MAGLKRFIKSSLLIICFAAGLLAVLNIPVTSRQGVNYAVRTVKMPVYVKIMEFLDRDYHYRELTERICQSSNSNKDKVLALFKWTHQNIRRDIPQGWPIIDDHAWHIIVRGYGVGDQCSDVFTTLCNYAGTEAFFIWVYTANRSERISLSFVKIRQKWSVFDPYYGCYFKNKDGGLADIEEIKSGKWSMQSLGKKPDIDYAAYLINLPSVRQAGLSRANIQSPLNRLRYELKKLRR